MSAAFRCPTVLDRGGVGAMALLGERGCVAVDDLEGTIAGGGAKLVELAAIIADGEKLRRVGEESRRRALGVLPATC